MIELSDIRDVGRLTDGELRQQFDIVSTRHHLMMKQRRDYISGDLIGGYDDEWFSRLKSAINYSYEEKDLLRSELRKRGLLTPPPPPNVNSRTKIQYRYTCLVMAVKDVVPLELQQMVWNRSKKLFDDCGSETPEPG